MKTAQSVFEEHKDYEQAMRWVRNIPEAYRLDQAILQMMRQDRPPSAIAVEIAGLVLRNREWISQIDLEPKTLKR